ncbi:MAG: hypothetical protein JST00_46360 [Deltaproteobacteria bacterium]|nr:hypothetical protein [Deltaproteobacteria bacterium]
MFSPSRVRGGTFVDYLLLVALALGLVGGAFLVYRSAYGAGARCLASKIMGSGGQCEGGGGPKDRAEAVIAAAKPGEIDPAAGVCDSSGKCTNGACFGRGTPVLTPEGERPIEAIVPGDVVLAKDLESGRVSPRKVLATKVTPDKPSLRLELDREVIVVTNEHPFYVEGRGWTAAASLAPSDRIVTPGGTASVVSLAQRAEIEPTYNLEVDEDHTYFVGHTHALVHNDCNIAQGAWAKAWGRHEAAQVVEAAQRATEGFRQLTSPNQPPSMHAPGFDVEGARRKSIAAVSSNLSSFDAMMAQILHSPSSDPQAKRIVAQAITDGKVGQSVLFPPFPGGGPPGFASPMLFGPGNQKALQEMQDRAFAANALRLTFARYAAAQGTAEMKEKAAQVLASSAPRFDANKSFEVFGKKMQRALEQAHKAGDDDPMKKLGQLLYAQELSKDPKWADRVDGDRLKMLLERQLKDPTVVKELARMHDETMRDIKYSSEYRAHLDMLESEEFLLRLQLEGGEQAKKTLETEIGKVAAIDAAAAREILDRIVGRQVMADFFALDEDTQADAVGRSIDIHIAEIAKKDNALKDFTKNGVKAPADVLKRIAKVLKEQQAALAANRTGEASAAIEKITSDAAKAGQITPAQQSALQKVFKGLEHSDKFGHVSSVAAVAGLVALGLDVKDGEAFKSVDKGLSSTATLLKTANSLESYAKLGLYMRSGATAKLATTGRLATAIKLAKWAGPIADGISVYLDGKSAYANYTKGHMKEAVCDAGAATCATVSAIGGIAIAAGATGPAAPVALLVGTVGYLGFKGVKWLVADPDEIKALREAGVLRDTSGQALAAIHAREIRKYAGSCTSDRRNCPGPIGEEARRILDGEKRFPGTFDPFPLGGQPTGPLKFDGGNGTLKDDMVRERLWRMEAEVVRARGAKFYKDHGAAPGTCGSCH